MQIGQEIISDGNLNSDYLVASTKKIQSFSIQALPGCVVKIDGNSIMLGPAGLLNVDLAVKNITIPKDPNQGLLAGANTFMIIDYIYEDKEETANE